MSKRFTDSAKWDRPWFRKLPAPYKLAFLYLLDRCDRAGFWEIDEERMYFDMGLASPIEAPWKDLKNIVVSKDKRWLWITDFVEFQQGVRLNPKNRAHMGIILRLSKMEPIFKGAYKALPRALQGVIVEYRYSNSNSSSTVENSEPAKGKAPRFAPPTVDEVKAYCREKGYLVDAERFVNFYESKGWMVGKNKMQRWKAAVANFGVGGTGTASAPAKKHIQPDIQMRSVLDLPHGKELYPEDWERAMAEKLAKEGTDAGSADE